MPAGKRAAKSRTNGTQRPTVLNFPQSKSSEASTTGQQATTTNTEHFCATCPYWYKRPNNEAESHDVTRGTCRRFPPLLIPEKYHGTSRPPDASKGEKDQGPGVMILDIGVTRFITNFPTTISTWWCHEHPERKR